VNLIEKPLMGQQEFSAEYKGKRVRAYVMGERVFVDQADLDAITGNPYHDVPPGSGFLNPEYDMAYIQAKEHSDEFANWLQKEFGELTLTDYASIDFSRGR
jgi:hypothetical protein